MERSLPYGEAASPVRPASITIRSQEFPGRQEQMLATRVATKKATLPPRAIRSVARVSTAFAELDEEHRIVLCLHYLERLSLEQIAEVLDDTVESVREVYAGAVARLGSKGSRKRRRRKAA